MVISLVFNFIFENVTVTFVTFVTLRCGCPSFECFPLGQSSKMMINFIRVSQGKMHTPLLSRFRALWALLSHARDAETAKRKIIDLRGFSARFWGALLSALPA